MVKGFANHRPIVADPWTLIFIVSVLSERAMKTFPTLSVFFILIFLEVDPEAEII